MQTEKWVCWCFGDISENSGFGGVLVTCRVKNCFGGVLVTE
jgi:hypothetical protein